MYTCNADMTQIAVSVSSGRCALGSMVPVLQYILEGPVAPLVRDEVRPNGDTLRTGV